MPKGIKGFQKGYKYKMSEEHKHKIGSANAISKKGKKCSEETKKKMSESSAWKGKKRPDVSISMAGENHWNWKGGLAKDKRTGMEYSSWRSKVFERDNWTCQTCQARGVYLEAHHLIDWANFPESRYKIDNGVTLCKECHKLTANYKGKNKGKYLVIK